MKIVQYVALIILWLIFPPIFIILCKRWRILKLKTAIWLSLISPFAFGIYIVIGILIYFMYFNFYRTNHFVKINTLKDITHMQFPDFSVKEYEKGDMAFMGDYTDRIIIEFTENLPDSFFVTLDSLVKEGTWNRNGDDYYFSQMWGNGLPAPKGESEWADGSLSVVLSKDSREAEITHGRW